MFLYNGKCRMGRVGQGTSVRDMTDRPLFVGDIVLTFTADCVPDRLTAVVSDEFKMGIRSVDLDDPSMLRVLKVKDHSNVVAGEHWDAYGFSYREEPSMSYAIDYRFNSPAMRQRQELAAANGCIEELEIQLDEAEQLLTHAEGLLAQIGIITRGYTPREKGE